MTKRLPIETQIENIDISKVNAEDVTQVSRNIAATRRPLRDIYERQHVHLNWVWGAIIALGFLAVIAYFLTGFTSPTEILGLPLSPNMMAMVSPFVLLMAAMALGAFGCIIKKDSNKNKRVTHLKHALLEAIHQASDDEASDDEASNDEASNDEASNDEASNDEASNAANALYTVNSIDEERLCKGHQAWNSYSESDKDVAFYTNLAVYTLISGVYGILWTLGHDLLFGFIAAVVAVLLLTLMTLAMNFLFLHAGLYRLALTYTRIGEKTVQDWHLDLSNKLRVSAEDIVAAGEKVTKLKTAKRWRSLLLIGISLLAFPVSAGVMYFITKDPLPALMTGFVAFLAAVFAKFMVIEIAKIWGEDKHRDQNHIYGWDMQDYGEKFGMIAKDIPEWKKWVWLLGLLCTYCAEIVLLYVLLGTAGISLSWSTSAHALIFPFLLTLLTFMQSKPYVDFVLVHAFRKETKTVNGVAGEIDGSGSEDKTIQLNKAKSKSSVKLINPSPS